MVFAAHGHRVPQERFVADTFGDIADMPGQPHEILAALNRSYVDDDGVPFVGLGDTFTVSLETAAFDLENRRPLIVGALGHATVLTGLSWVVDNAGGFRVIEAVVRDPWPGNLSRRRLSPQEWANISFAARVECI
jgi:hypothetical protein